MSVRRLAPALLLSLVTLAACEHRRPAEEAAAPGASADAAVPAADAAPTDGAAAGAPADDAGAEAARPPVAPPSQGLSGTKKILFEPAEPKAGEAFTVRAGPITFRNGCEGIAKTDVKREGATITVTWTPKQVPPDAMCTMALHEDWIVATVDGVPAGPYTVSVNEVGETTLVVAAAAP